jgi:hypothetical protein
MARCTVHAASDGLFRVWDEDEQRWTAGPFETFEEADDARVTCEGRRRRRAPVAAPSALQLAAPADRVPRARQGKAGQDPSVVFVQQFSDGSWRAWNPLTMAFLRPWPTREDAMLQAQQIGRPVPRSAPAASQGSLFGAQAPAQRSLGLAGQAPARGAQLGLFRGNPGRLPAGVSVTPDEWGNLIVRHSGVRESWVHLMPPQRHGDPWTGCGMISGGIAAHGFCGREWRTREGAIRAAAGWLQKTAARIRTNPGRAGRARVANAPALQRRVRDLERSVTALSETMHAIASAGARRRALPAPRRR